MHRESSLHQPLLLLVINLLPSLHSSSMCPAIADCSPALALDPTFISMLRAPTCLCPWAPRPPQAPLQCRAPRQQAVEAHLATVASRAASGLPKSQACTRPSMATSSSFTAMSPLPARITTRSSGCGVGARVWSWSGRTCSPSSSSPTARCRWQSALSWWTSTRRPCRHCSSTGYYRKAITSSCRQCWTKRQQRAQSAALIKQQ
jgi:hypothetical protein